MEEHSTKKSSSTSRSRNRRSRLSVPFIFRSQHQLCVRSQSAMYDAGLIRNRRSVDHAIDPTEVCFGLCEYSLHLVPVGNIGFGH